MPLLTKISELYNKLLKIATTEFINVVEDGEIFCSESNEPLKLRLYLYDNSFIDIYHSVKSSKYSYHWERRLTVDKIFRHDNAPHQKWKYVETYPKHFHNGSEETVLPSYISDNPELAIKEFLSFVVKNIVNN